MNNYIEIQNQLISTAQSLFDSQDRVDAVVFDGKEFVIYANTHASSRPQFIHYLSPGARGFNELKEVLNK